MSINQPLIAAALAVAPLTALAGCLTYEREATLTGVMHWKPATASPDDARMTAGERVPVLDLNAAVCVEGQGPDRIHVRREGVTSVQLVFPPELSIRLAEKRPVTVEGTLSGRVTGNPRVPVLLRVKALKNRP